MTRMHEVPYPDLHHNAFSFIVLLGLAFTEYLLSGQAPPIKEVNDGEPLFSSFAIS